jgi:hypothetical protein
MRIGKEIGDFSLKSTSTRYAEDGGNVQIDVDGKATAYGTVLGTLILRSEPGAKAGSCSRRGQGFLENGETVVGAGSGRIGAQPDALRPSAARCRRSDEACPLIMTLS